MAFTYIGLTEKKERHIVTEEEVNRNLQRLAQENPRIAEITDRPTERGDEVVLDYAGFCDGVQFPGGTAENQTLVLGSGMFIPGFEEQLLDKVPGQEVTVEVTFPEQYHAEELAGKKAEFRCKLKSIRQKTPYELDDVFAREFGHCESLEQMRQRMQESLQAYADEQGEMDLQDRLLRQAADSMEYNPTEEEITEGIEEQMKVLQAQLAQQGLNLEMYCSFMNTTEEKLREDNREVAIATIRSQKAIDRIIILEGLSAEPADLEKAIAVVARRNRMTVEELEPYMDAEFQQVITKSVLTGKVMRLIRDAAVITE